MTAKAQAITILDVDQKYGAPVVRVPLDVVEMETVGIKMLVVRLRWAFACLSPNAPLFVVCDPLLLELVIDRLYV